MEWYAWIAWATTTIAAVGGLVLGIRAERRTSMYSLIWAPDTRGRKLTLHNRTSEDASDVVVEVAGGQILRQTAKTLVQRDQAVEVILAPFDGEGKQFEVTWAVSWVRTKTGKRYRYSPSAKQGSPFMENPEFPRIIVV